jgi:hypothetical protein
MAVSALDPEALCDPLGKQTDYTGEFATPSPR